MAEEATSTCTTATVEDLISTSEFQKGFVEASNEQILNTKVLKDAFINTFMYNNPILKNTQEALIRFFMSTNTTNFINEQIQNPVILQKISSNLFLTEQFSCESDNGITKIQIYLANTLNNYKDVIDGVEFYPLDPLKKYMRVKQRNWLYILMKAGDEWWYATMLDWNDFNNIDYAGKNHLVLVKNGKRWIIKTNDTWEPDWVLDLEYDFKSLEETSRGTNSLNTDTEKFFYLTKSGKRWLVRLNKESYNIEIIFDCERDKIEWWDGMLKASKWENFILKKLDDTTWEYKQSPNVPHDHLSVFHIGSYWSGVDDNRQPLIKICEGDNFWLIQYDESWNVIWARGIDECSDAKILYWWKHFIKIQDSKSWKRWLLNRKLGQTEYKEFMNYDYTSIEYLHWELVVTINDSDAKYIAYANEEWKFEYDPEFAFNSLQGFYNFTDVRWYTSMSWEQGLIQRNHETKKFDPLLSWYNRISLVLNSAWIIETEKDGGNKYFELKFHNVPNRHYTCEECNKPNKPVVKQSDHIH